MNGGEMMAEGNGEGNGVRADSDGSGAFEVSVPLAKAWEDGAGDLWFEGVAASTALDRQRERMSKQAVEKMSRFAGLDLLPRHDAGPLRELGVVEECWVDNDEFRVRGRLDKTNPEAWRLFERVQAGKRYGLSVGGRVLAAKWQFDPEAGQMVRLIEDVTLDHIAVCRSAQAANPATYLGVMAKAAEGVDEEDAQASEEQVERDGAGARLAKLGRQVLELTRGLWSAGRDEEEDEQEAGGGETQWAAVLSEVGRLAKQVTGMAEELGRVAEVVRGLDGKQAGNGVGAADGEGGSGEGGRKSLEGQERTSGRRANMWKGVL